MHGIEYLFSPQFFSHLFTLLADKQRNPFFTQLQYNINHREYKQQSLSPCVFILCYAASCFCILSSTYSRSKENEAVCD